MTDTTAKIRAKGLDGTGFTEDLASRLFNRVGHSLKAIIELQVIDKHGPNLDGKRGIELVITHLEVADDANLEEHLNELTRTIYYNRGLEGHTGTTTEGQERTVSDVLASGGKFKPHPFIVVDAAAENPICDVCGGIEASAVHSTQEILADTQDDDEDAETTAYVDTEGDLDDVDPYFFVHAKGGSLPGEETICALHARFGKNLHTHADHDQVTCPDCLEQLDIDASFHGDDDEPWDYPAPEPLPASTVADPFTTPTPA